VPVHVRLVGFLAAARGRSGRDETVGAILVLRDDRPAVVDHPAVQQRPEPGVQVGQLRLGRLHEILDHELVGCIARGHHQTTEPDHIPGAQRPDLILGYWRLEFDHDPESPYW
jgi:hypothetical protein